MIIGLQGYAGAGKSTVATYLAERHGFARRHIKEPIRNMFWALLHDAGIGEDGLDWFKYSDDVWKNEPIEAFGGRSGREIQQFLGTEFGREFIHPDLWLNIWHRWALEQPGHVVQESVRFANEAERCDVVWEIRREGYGAHNGHVSEGLPVTPDVVLVNNGSVNLLYRQVDEALRKVGA